MSAEVEVRRFRTWDPDTDVPANHVHRTIVKYGVLRLLRAWHMRLLLVVTLIFAVVMLGTYSYDLTDNPNGADTETFGVAALTSLFVTGVYLLFVAAPMFAEDLRFNAHLFYFSKPVSAREYVTGKVMVLAATLSIVSILPFLLFGLLSLADAAIAQPIEWWSNNQLTGTDLADWQATSINSVGDWVLAMSFVLPALIVLTAFVSSVFVCLSAWTERAWHAAIGAFVVIAGWSILGLTAAEGSRTAMADVWSPVGWVVTMVWKPLEFHWGYHKTSWYADAAYPQSLEGLGGALAISYILCIGATIGAIALTLYRLRRTEGLA